MTIYLAAENDTALSDLVDRAIAGDGVVVTRHGKAVAELRAVPVEKKWKSAEEMLAWLDERRVTSRQGSESASETLAQLRESY